MSATREDSCVIDGPSEIRRIRVLHVITRMVKGGAQENVLDLTVLPDATKFACILVTGPSEGPEGSLVDKAIARGADVREIPCLVREISPLTDFRAVVALVQLIRKEKPDIVHTHTSKAGIVGRIAARIARVKVIIHEPHGHVFTGYYGKFKSGVFIALERGFARFANRLVMLTENERTDHLAYKIAPAYKFVTIHSGVDYMPMLNDASDPGALRTPLGIRKDAKVIGTLGRLVEVKGQIYLIEAMPAILSRVPNAHLVLMGSGPLQDALQRRATGLGIGANVHFAGYRKDVAACLKDIDIFVLPSLNEGMGRVLVEAMVMSLPVVASDVCGIKDLVQDGRNGRLVPAEDSAAIAAAVTEILIDPELAKKMGKEGYDVVVPNYGVEVMLKQMETLYCAEVPAHQMAQGDKTLKSLVTGGAGFIGSNLVDRLIERGDEVYVVDNLSTGSVSNIRHHLGKSQFHFLNDDIVTSQSLEPMISKCDVIYHLAAAVGVKYIVNDPLGTILTNVRGTENVLLLAARHWKRVVIASTSEIYGKSSGGALAEDADRILGPTTINRWSYSASKAIDEHFAYAFHQKGLPISIVRYFNSYGPRVNEAGYGSVIANFVRQALVGDPLTVHGTGSQSRCFTYVYDTVRGTMLAADRQEAIGEAVNIGNEREITILQLAQMIKSITGSNSEIVTQPYHDYYGQNYEDTPRRQPDVRKAKRILGFSADTSLETGLKETIDWCRENYSVSNS